MSHQLLSDAIDDFLRFRRSSQIKKSTIKTDTTVLKRFLGVAGNVWGHQINEIHVIRYFEDASRTRQPQTLRSDHNVLNVFFEWCRHTKRMELTPAPMFGRRPCLWWKTARRTPASAR